MEILIHGTKGGCKTLYPVSDVPEVMFRFASDARRTDSKGNTGWELYSLAFSGNGCIFSKYKGVRDVLRQYGGFIAFSIHIPHSQKMLGSEIKNLLDELAGRYFSSYVVDGNLDGDVHEDWSFVSSTINFYKDKLRQVFSRDSIFSPSGSGEPAFLYYENDTHLCKLMDAPNQDEYIPYKQVFFIGQQYKDSEENPLYALRHDPQADLTNRIDLENTKYRLRLPQRQSSDNEAEVEVRVNGSSKNTNDKIYRKNTISITYSKRFYETVKWEGKISDPAASQYIEVTDETVIVRPLSIDKMQPLKQNIQVMVAERNGKPVSEYTITATTRTGMVKPLGQAEYIPFTGNELGEQWRIAVETPDGRKDFQSIVPENDVAHIRLQPQKIVRVRFNVTDESNENMLLTPYISYKGIQTGLENGEYEFKGDDADSVIDITISQEGYESNTFRFCPSKETTCYVQLKKSSAPLSHNKKSFYLEVDEAITTVYPQILHDKSMVRDIKPEFKKRGYHFVKWEDHSREKKETYDGYYKAIFKEVWWHKFRWYLIGAATVILVALLILLVRPTQPQKSSYVYTNVKDSISSCKNNPEALRALKERWESNKPAIAQTGGFLGIGGKPDSTDYKQWEQGLEHIDEAVKISQSQDKEQTSGDKDPATEVSQTPTATPTPAVDSNTQKQNEIRDAFWDLYKSKKRNKDNDWLPLCRKYMGYTANPYVQFLNKILADNQAFDKFKKMPKITDYNDKGLEKLKKAYEQAGYDAKSSGRESGSGSGRQAQQKEKNAEKAFLRLVKSKASKSDYENFIKDYKGTQSQSFIQGVMGGEQRQLFIEFTREKTTDLQGITDLNGVKEQWNGYKNEN